MTALTSNFVGSIETISRDLRPLAGGQHTYSGHLCVANPGGTKPGFYGEATGAAGEVAVGRFYGQYGAVDASAAADGALFADVEFFRERSLILVNNDTGTAIVAANRETMVSIKDAITATQDTDGALADMGIFYDFSEDGSGLVWVELPYPSSAQDQGPAPSPGGGAAFTARAVASSALAAYAGSGTSVLTASATGAIGAQDGVTLVAGDVILLHTGVVLLTALKDAGPWIVTNPGAGGVKYVLTRPSWWFTGAAVPGGKTVAVTEGAVFAGTVWMAHAVKGKIIDTDDPDLFPKSVTLQVTMNGASPSLFAITTIPLRSATKSNAIAMYAGSGTPAATTLAYQPGAITPATLGNSGSVTISAVKAAMAAVNTDTAVVNVTIENQ